MKDEVGESESKLFGKNPIVIFSEKVVRRLLLR
jgi:hypothetical protein